MVRRLQEGGSLASDRVVAAAAAAATTGSGSRLPAQQQSGGSLASDRVFDVAAAATTGSGSRLPAQQQSGGSLTSSDRVTTAAYKEVKAMCDRKGSGSNCKQTKTTKNARETGKRRGGQGGGGWNPFQWSSSNWNPLLDGDKTGYDPSFSMGSFKGHPPLDLPAKSNTSSLQGSPLRTNVLSAPGAMLPARADVDVFETSGASEAQQFYLPTSSHGMPPPHPLGLSASAEMSGGGHRRRNSSSSSSSSKPGGARASSSRPSASPAKNSNNSKNSRKPAARVSSSPPAAGGRKKKNPSASASAAAPQGSYDTLVPLS